MVKLIAISTMQKPFVNKWVKSLSGTAILCAIAQGAVAGKTSLQFDKIFKAANEPASISYRANFTAPDGAIHSLQVWRDGQLHLRRKTDDTIDTYVIRHQTDLSKYQMIIVDYKQHITTKINRDNLIHLGAFNDWFDMAHGLRHPKSGYQLISTDSPKEAPKPISDCQWYALSQQADTHRICWSQKEHLPLIIWSDHHAKAVWQISEVSHQRIGKDIFILHDNGFVRNDANADITGD